jgi:hypothetical protein
LKLEEEVLGMTEGDALDIDEFIMQSGCRVGMSFIGESRGKIGGN